MNNFGLKVEHVCSLPTNHLEPVKLCGKGNKHRVYFIYSYHSTLGEGHAFSYFLLLLWTACIASDLKKPARWKAKVCWESCFVKTHVKRYPKGHCPVCSTWSNSSYLSLLLGKKKILSLISRQVPINPQNLDILANLFSFFGLLLTNMLLHMTSLVMGIWRRGGSQGE